MNSHGIRGRGLGGYIKPSPLPSQLPPDTVRSVCSLYLSWIEGASEAENIDKHFSSGRGAR